MSDRPSSIPYPDAVRLLAKARGGVAYATEHPRGYSALDRYQNLWRAWEFLAKEAGVEPASSLQTQLDILAKETDVDLVSGLRDLGRSFQEVAKQGDNSLQGYIDSDLPFPEHTRALHLLKKNVATLARVRPADHLTREIREAAVHTLVALRNSVSHTGAMSTSVTSAPFPNGCAVLDRLACVAYGQLAGIGREDVERFIRESKTETRAPKW